MISTGRRYWMNKYVLLQQYTVACSLCPNKLKALKHLRKLIAFFKLCNSDVRPTIRWNSLPYHCLWPGLWPLAVSCCLQSDFGGIKWQYYRVSLLSVWLNGVKLASLWDLSEIMWRLMMKTCKSVANQFPSDLKFRNSSINSDIVFARWQFKCKMTQNKIR